MGEEKPAVLRFREAGAIVNGFVLYLILLAVSIVCLVLGSMPGRIVGLVLLVVLFLSGHRAVTSIFGRYGRPS